MLLLAGHVFVIFAAILPLACSQQHISSLPGSKTASPASNNQVYIVGSSRKGITAISTALRTLGYRQILPPAITIDDPDLAAVTEGTFSVISLEFEVHGLCSILPGVKFIVPVEDENASQIDYSQINRGDRGWPNKEAYGEDQGQPGPYRNLSSLISLTHEFLAQSGGKPKVLEFQIKNDRHRMGDDWPTLCKFLGLGYSTVERLRLRKFPDGRKTVWAQSVQRMFKTPRIWPRHVW